MLAPAPTREKGQRSLDPLYLNRILPQWATPEWMMGEKWRAVVRNQPVATICRDSLIAYINALDWKIEAREPTERDERKEEIKYYTKGFESAFGYDFADHVEWVGQDLLDLPFGGACEVLREGDAPEGKVLTVIPLDGATLFPTLNADLPVGQRVLGASVEPIFFPAHAINRTLLTPRTEILREGWGMAPPEKIYLALEMLRRGDMYYANLLLDTPEAGLLDLMDMEKESAEQWVDSFRALLTGIDPWKIPVLYEHEKEVKFIPFTQPPTEIIYDKVMLKMAAFVAAGYGLSLSDIGMQAVSDGGETLAGSIRQERRTRNSGISTAKKKFLAYFNRLLPEELTFRWIDYDDELNVSRGRARMATMTAFSTGIDKRVISPKEARLQMIADGLITISIPEDVPTEDFDIIKETQQFPTPERPGLMGNPTAPSQGGYGESNSGVGKSAHEDAFAVSLKKSFEDLLGKADTRRVKKLVKLVAPRVYEQVKGAVTELSDTVSIRHWNEYHEKAIYDDADSEVWKAFEVDEKVDNELEKDWWELDINEDEVVAILSAAYLAALKSAAMEMVQDMYVEGYLDAPFLDPDLNFRLTNEFMQRELQLRALDMVKNVNEGTKYYLKRMLISGVRQGLTEKEIVDRIRQGVDIDVILSDNKFMQTVLQKVKSDLRDLTEVRIRSIVSYELALAENKAYIDQYKRVGLERKHWEHFGSDIPCDICQINIDAGNVPLDYKYESVFGPTENGPAHPHEHCGIRYDREELKSLISAGNFGIWIGD